MRRLTALLLAAMLLLAGVAMADVKAADYHDYSQFPLVEDGEEIVIKIAINKNDTHGIDWDKMWWWNWLSKVTGVTFEIEQISESAMEQRRSLLLAGGALPDLLWGLGLSTADIVRYGQEEKLFLPLNDYITPEIMPNLCKMLEAEPAIRSNITCLDGNIYTLFYRGSGNHGESARCFIDDNKLEEVGVETPRTLDELVDFLYAVKELYPDSIPLGGSYASRQPIHYVMGAYGYIAGLANDGTTVAVRNGRAVIPAADPEFKQVLELLKQFYDDGIISRDFFTLDKTGVHAQFAEGMYAIFPYVPFIVTPDYVDYSHWSSVYPLTSDVNDTPVWRKANLYGVGGFVLSKDTKYAEEILKIADFIYSDIGFTYAWEGPYCDSGDTLDMVKGWYFDEKGKRVNIDVEEGTIANSTTANHQIGFSLAYTIGNLGGSLTDPAINTRNKLIQSVYGVEVAETPFDPVTASADAFFRKSMEYNITPYEVDGFPYTYYMSNDDSIAMNDLKMVLEPYMQSEMAKFITGARSLDEYDKYLEELNTMGCDEYLAYYEAIYDSFVKNLG